MIRAVQRFLVVMAVLVTAGSAGGCAVDPKPGRTTNRTTLFVPGVLGDGTNYNGLRQVIADSGSAVETVTWGLPKVLFVGNFSGQSVHADAETKLAAVIDTTAGDVDLIGHSAGCGVILGALAKAHRDVGRVVLIAPSVSPQYDMRAALGRARAIHSFSSHRDTFFLKWRCGTFGTYDNVKTPAAGYAGFATGSRQLIEHTYDAAWEALGNDGGHGGGTGRAFVQAILVPLLAPRPGRGEQTPEIKFVSRTRSAAVSRA